LDLLAISVSQIIIGLNNPFKALFYCAFHVIKGICFGDLTSFFFSHRLFRVFCFLKFRNLRLNEASLNKSYFIFL
jgi:hypothetical protein